MRALERIFSKRENTVRRSNGGLIVNARRPGDIQLLSHLVRLAGAAPSPRLTRSGASCGVHDGGV